MDANHVEASLCFPNTLPRLCGQTFAERADKELPLLCVRAYNDWMIDEWCSGEAYGRLIPVTIVPLWDAKLAGDEVRRCAERGSHANSFTENPYPLKPPEHPLERLGPTILGVPGDGHGGLHAHRFVVPHAGNIARRTVHHQLRADLPERHGLTARLRVLGDA
jgi:predicted TIM-barrel fold metal-dependent hydrolase